MNRLSTAERTDVISALVEGGSLRAAAQTTGVARMTVERLLRDMGAACQRMHEERARSVKAKRVRCDEIWSFDSGGKRDPAPGVPGKHPGAGDAWTWTALDADSRLLLWWMVGSRDAPTARRFLAGVSARLANRVRLTTDGPAVHLEAADGAAADDIDEAALARIYGAGHAPTRSRSDRRIETHGHSVALHAAHYNFCKIHPALRVTPAMEAGISNHVWSLEELVVLLEP